MNKVKARVVAKARKLSENIGAVKSHVKKHVRTKVHKNRTHITKAIHTVSSLVSHIEYAFLLIGSLSAFFWISSYATWGGGVNNYLIYPLDKVSTVDCRVLDFETLWIDNPCVIDLPIIKWAKYSDYKDNELYTQIYTVLHWAPYEGNSWDMSKWAHLWVDIATSKNTPVYSIAHGTVTFAWEKPGYWNVVKIKFDYKWKTYHTLFAHLNQILVKTWDSVVQWQMVAKSGNSWSTFGALGGYHVHWEITNDFYGGPAYGFYGCKDLNKWHTEIINNWLCREELYKYTYDAIAFVENSRKDLSYFGDWKPVAINTIITSNTDEHSHESASDSESIHVAEVTHNINIEQVAVVDSTNNNQDIPDELAHEVGQIASASDVPLLTEIDTVKMVRLTMPPSNKLSYKAQEFVKNYTVFAEYKAVSHSEVEATLTIINNKTQEPFHGILPVSFQFLSNDKGINILKESVSLVRDGKASNTITFTGTNTATITLMLDLQKIGEIKI